MWFVTWSFTMYVLYVSICIGVHIVIHDWKDIVFQCLLETNLYISRVPNLSCMVCHSLTSWENPAGDDCTIPWNMHGRTAACYPCTAARLRAILACAIVRAPHAREAPCSTSTPGPWFCHWTTRRMSTEKGTINKLFAKTKCPCVPLLMLCSLQCSLGKLCC